VQRDVVERRPLTAGVAEAHSAEVDPAGQHGRISTSVWGGIGGYDDGCSDARNRVAVSGCDRAMPTPGSCATSSTPRTRNLEDLVESTEEILEAGQTGWVRQLQEALDKRHTTKTANTSEDANSRHP
jgi:hypothetical protein